MRSVANVNILFQFSAVCDVTKPSARAQAIFSCLWRHKAISASSSQILQKINDGWRGLVIDCGQLREQKKSLREDGISSCLWRHKDISASLGEIFRKNAGRCTSARAWEIFRKNADRSMWSVAKRKTSFCILPFLWRHKKSVRHRVFLGGLPAKYFPSPTGLNFGDRTRTGVFPVVWPYAKMWY